MKILTTDIIQFFHSHNFVIVSSIGKDGFPHSACKGIVKIDRNGKVYLFDLYKKKTFENLRHNPHISLTAVDEHKFKGYCLKGKARIVRSDRLRAHIINAWENKITSRIAHRFLKNIKGEKGHPMHPESLLPKPRYLIIVSVCEIIDLTPSHLKQPLE